MRGFGAGLIVSVALALSLSLGALVLNPLKISPGKALSSRTEVSSAAVHSKTRSARLTVQVTDSNGWNTENGRLFLEPLDTGPNDRFYGFDLSSHGSMSYVSGEFYSDGVIPLPPGRYRLSYSHSSWRRSPELRLLRDDEGYREYELELLEGGPRFDCLLAPCK